MRLFNRFFILAFAIVSLVACGGGSGGGGGTTTSADTTPPTVSSVSPTASATGIATNSVITATFGEDIFATTVDTSSFTLTNNGSVSGTVSFDGNTNIATFTPSNKLPLLTSHTATLTTAITDLAGNAMATNYNWSFTTADGTWKTAGLIETDNAGRANFPQIGFDSNGNALAVWQQSDGARNNIWANRYVAGAGWGAAELIETDNAGRAEYPQIAIDSSGNALAVWHQYDGARYNIWANRYVAGTGWGSAELIESNAWDATNPQIAIDNNSNALVVWQQYDDTNRSIWANRYVAGAGWGAAELIETDNAGYANSPQIAVDSNGNALAVWRQSDGTRDNIWANRYVVGAGWGSAELIETDNGDAQSPQIAVDSNGNALAVWQQFDGARDNIWANRYVAGAGWGAAELIETDNAGRAEYPQIAIDSSGNALAVWYQYDGSFFNIIANRYVAGTGWVTEELIETDNAGNAFDPQIAIDSNGNALAVWYQHDGARDNISANRYVAGTGWGAAELIDIGNGRSAFSPQIAIDSNGNALAVWYQFGGSTANIASNRFE